MSGSFQLAETGDARGKASGPDHHESDNPEYAPSAFPENHSAPVSLAEL
jgi:hypothetical protein